MSDVEFDDVHTIDRPQQRLAESETLLSRILIRFGIARNIEHAQKKILIFSLFIMCVALIIFLYAMSL